MLRGLHDGAVFQQPPFVGDAELSKENKDGVLGVVCTQGALWAWESWMQGDFVFQGG